MFSSIKKAITSSLFTKPLHVDEITQIAETVKSCTEDTELTTKQIKKMIDCGPKHLQKNPGFTGKIDRGLYGLERSLFINEEGHIFILMTRNRTRADKIISDEGSFKKVKFAVNIDTNKRVALGTIGANSGIEEAEHEIELTKLFKNSAYVIQIDGAGKGKTSDGRERLYILMEYCEGGTLFDAIIDEKIENKEGVALELLKALKELFDKKVIHRDLKPENILLQKDSDGQLHVKIVDFGLSCKGDANTEDRYDFCGSPEWFSPEAFNEGPSMYPRDVWAMGHILYTLFSGEWITPEDSKVQETEEQYISRLADFSQSLTDAQIKARVIQTAISPVFSKLITDYMLRVKPEDRLNPTELLEFCQAPQAYEDKEYHQQMSMLTVY